MLSGRTPTVSRRSRSTLVFRRATRSRTSDKSDVGVFEYLLENMHLHEVKVEKKDETSLKAQQD